MKPLTSTKSHEAQFQSLRAVSSSPSAADNAFSQHLETRKCEFLLMPLSSSLLLLLLLLLCNQSQLVHEPILCIPYSFVYISLQAFASSSARHNGVHWSHVSPSLSPSPLASFAPPPHVVRRAVAVCITGAQSRAMREQNRGVTCDACLLNRSTAYRVASGERYTTSNFPQYFASDRVSAGRG